VRGRTRQIHITHKRAQPTTEPITIPAIAPAERLLLLVTEPGPLLVADEDDDPADDDLEGEPLPRLVADEDDDLVTADSDVDDDEEEEEEEETGINPNCCKRL